MVEQTQSGVRCRVYREELHPCATLDFLLKNLRIGKKNGKLVINYSNGSPSGYVEWQERKEET